MHFYLYILLYYILITKNMAKKTEVKCPSHCKCDTFEKLRRASCTNKNLAVIESNLPQQSQLLDLSYNQISHLDKNIFIELNLLSLKLLNISHNKVSQIHMNAFDGLIEMKSLDMSYNAIQYIIRNWFWSLKSLEELYLRGNSFSKFDDETSLFDSGSLKRLDLSSCRISYIGKYTLMNLPNLEYLDLSENFLIHLNVAVVKHLKNLTILNAQNNTFSCDQALTNLTNYTTKTGIRFENPCNKKKTDSEKFQRIINMADPEDEKNSWIYDEEEVRNKTDINMTCNNDTRSDKTLLQEIVDLSPILSILIPFVYGIAVGILIGCSVRGCSSKKKEDLEESSYVSFDQVGDTHLRRRSGFGRAFRREEDQQTLPLREWHLSESTPVLFRKNLVHL